MTKPPFLLLQVKISITCITGTHQKLQSKLYYSQFFKLELIETEIRFYLTDFMNGNVDKQLKT